MNERSNSPSRASFNTDRPAAQPALLRVLGPIGATAVVVGSVIGSGIFRKANIVGANVGEFNLVILVWVVCGLISLFGALSLAELAAMLPKAGGQYVYLREAYGSLVAFLWGWAEFWIIRTGSIAALAVIFSQSLLTLGATSASHAGWSGSEWLPRAIAVGAIVVLVAVNYAGTRWGGLTQDITTFLKIAILITLAVLPFVTGTVLISNLSSAVAHPEGQGAVAGFAAAMAAVFWAYDGWGNIGPVAEEIRQPHRNIPLALMLGMFVVIGLYLAVTVAYHLILPMNVITHTDFVAATAFEAMLGKGGAAIAAAAVMISTFGALNANLLTGPRVLFAMARDKLLFRPLAAVHPRCHTPHRAIVAVGAWAIVLILSADLLKTVQVPDWASALPGWLSEPLAHSLAQMKTKALYDMLTDYVIFGAFIFYVLGVAAVLVLRRQRPDLLRPYRTWGYPVVPIVFIVSATGFLTGMFVTSPLESLLGVAFIGLGALAYRFRPKIPSANVGN